MANFKDTVSTICGLIVAVGTAVFAAGIEMPTWLKTTIGLLMAVSVGILGFLQGRNADGSKKTVNQSEWQQKAKDTPPPIEQ